jgi:HlyD family secretion protein
MTSRQTRWIVTGGVAIVATSGLVFLLWPRPLDVDAAMVRNGPLAETVSDQGVARVRQAYLVSAPVNGRLERLPLEVGDRVVANQTIVARIRPILPEFLDARTRAQAESNVQAARSSLESATAQRDRLRADATRTRDQLRRIADLAKQGVVAPQELETAQADADQAANALRAAEADIRTRQANLASAQAALATPAASASQVVTATSPASGVVTHLLQQSARTVTVGTPLVEVGDTTGLEAAIEFLSQDAVKIRPGQHAEIYNWGGPANIPAEVRLVEPQGFTKVSALGVEDQRTLVILQFTGPLTVWGGLAPGYRVWGRVYLRAVPTAILAPLGALVRDRGGWAVYRIEEGRARLRPVRVGTLTDRDAEVLSGLSSGDQVIAYPSDQVQDGLRVRARTSQVAVPNESAFPTELAK